MTLKRELRIYVLESKYEFLKLVRMPMYVVFTLLFPLMFYVFFGLAMRTGQPEGTMSMSVYLLGTYGTFGIIGVSLFGFGVGVAVERGLGWLQVKRASPMPPLAHLFSRVAVCILFSIVLIAAMFTLGVVFGHVRMPLAQWLTLGSVLVAGCVPFCAVAPRRSLTERTQLLRTISHRLGGSMYDHPRTHRQSGAREHRSTSAFARSRAAELTARRREKSMDRSRG